jgi:hypothetical protein
MATDLLIHGTGVFALLLNVIAMCRSCERSLRLQSGLSGVAWALNNLLLGANAAAALTLVSASRTCTSAMLLQRGARLRAIGFGGFSLVTLVIGLASWDGWPSAMVTAATLLSTYSMFYMRGRALRWIMVAVSALWMHHAWTHDSWEQLVANVATMAAALVGVWRLERVKPSSRAGGSLARPRGQRVSTSFWYSPPK